MSAVCISAARLFFFVEDGIASGSAATVRGLNAIQRRAVWELAALVEGVLKGWCEGGRQEELVNGGASQLMDLRRRRWDVRSGEMIK